jgi:hypothetical protein
MFGIGPIELIIVIAITLFSGTILAVLIAAAFKMLWGNRPD